MTKRREVPKMQRFESGGCTFEGAFCTTHKCGIDADGALRPCNERGCPHCGKDIPRVNTPLLLKRLRAAQARYDRWVPRAERACREVRESSQDIRRLWKRLEDAGVNVDPMELTKGDESE